MPLVIDIEAYDPYLDSLGDGSIRKDGNVLMVGTYDGHTYRWYEPSDPQLQEILASNEPKICHNAMYDLSWLHVGYGYKINGILHDTMTRMALINEYVDLNLDACCKYFKIEGKNAADTIEAWFDSVKKQWGLRGDVWDNADVVWMHPEGQRRMLLYNERDCKATWELFMKQEPLLNEVREVYDRECKLIPMVLEMKRVGIRIDTVERDRFTAYIRNKLDEVEQQLSYAYGITRKTVASPKQMTLAMNALGIRSPLLTETGGQSWSADAIEMIDHPSAELIQQVKNYTALLSKYLTSALVDNVVDNRIHCTFYSTKRDEGGTITGRFASRKPNLQQIPSMEEKHGQQLYGQEMRAMFLPEEGCMLAALDYSQIEYLLLAHYAAGPQAEWFREQANDGIDFHTVAMSITGIDNRTAVKRLNYGVIYGMGVNKMFATNRKVFKTLDNTRMIYNQYHNGMPVIRDTMNAIQYEAKLHGYVKTIGGRIMHKPRPVYYDGKWNDQLYKMTNKKIQGSAADVMKQAMVASWEAGIYSTLIPHLTVHDELVNSVPYNNAGVEALTELHRIMEAAYRDVLSVPMKAVCEVGPNWGWWKGDIWEEMQRGEFNRTLAA